jgi:hypothetical protein
MKLADWVVAAIPIAWFASPIHAAPIQFLVVPNAQTSTPGNDSSGSLGVSGLGGEFQEVFGRSQFSSVAGSLLITQFAYRLKPDTGSINATVTSFSISMSTSPYAPNTNAGNTLITPAFAANRGPDNTVVLSGGAGVLWSSQGCTVSVTCPFDIVFTLSTPFLYDPSKGFLLLDTEITGYNGVGTGELDVQRYDPPGGVVAGVTPISAGSQTGIVELDGNIVQLGFTVVTPEPASCALMLGGLGVLMAIRRRPS